MDIISKVSAALQQVFSVLAEKAAEVSKVIVRKRKFTSVSLAQTFVLGFLEKPNASDEDLAQMANLCGAEVTPQAVEQRYTLKLVTFLETLFRSAVQIVIGAENALAPLLERFTSVLLLDSSTMTLPDGMQEQYPGCGGSYGSGKAALKLQTELDLRSGAIAHIEIEPGRSPDSATVRQKVPWVQGSLRITDLGYFCTAVFATMIEAGAYFLSRLQFGTSVLRPNGEWIEEFLPWLAKQPGPFVDVSILVSKGTRLPCRMIAWRLPPEQAAERRRKLREQTQKKRGQQPSAARLAWCDWTILVTNVPLEMLSPKEALVLYRARWQVELLFKRWKSQGLVAMLRGSTEVRQMVGIWSRLLAALIQHWLVVASAWGDPTRSLSKVCEAVRKFVGRLCASLDHPSDLERVLTDLCRIAAKTCKRNKRTKPGTFELLNDVDLLEFRLT